MTENDPVGTPYRPTAGEVGLHRQEPGTANADSMGQSLNVPQVHAPPKPYLKPVVSHGRGDPLAGLSESSIRPRPEAPPEQAGPDGEASYPQPHRSEEDRLRDEIFRTREELGLTVEALAQKADVKKRAQQKMADTKERAAEMAGRLREAASHSAKVTADRTGTVCEAMPAKLKDAAGQVSGQARSRPAVLIAAGVATMIGAGWLNWAERRCRTGRVRRVR